MHLFDLMWTAVWTLTLWFTAAALGNTATVVAGLRDEVNYLIPSLGWAILIVFWFN